MEAKHNMNQTQTQTTIDATLAAAGSKATYTGAGMTISGWYLSSEFAVLCGIVLGLGGFAVNFVFQLRRDRREQREHAARMESFYERV